MPFAILHNRFFRNACLAVLLACLGCSCHEQPSRPPRPSVLFIMVDDLNHLLGCLGDSVVQTPHIDRLARQGVLFERAYCQFPLCNPSRASLLTGLRPSTLGINSLKGHFRDAHPDLISLPQLFRQQGYFTARAGKIFHMGVPDAIAIRSSGKDDPLAWDSTFNAPGFELNSNGAFDNATPWETHGVGTGGAISWLRAEKGDHYQHDYNVASRVIEWLKAHRTKPFFLAAGFIRPHVPLVAPKRFFAHYDSARIAFPPALAQDRRDIPPMAIHTFAANFNLSARDRAQAIKAYYASISFVDEQVGRLLDALETQGLADHTLVVLASDHGFQLGEHGLWFKNYLFRESATAPLILRDPTRPELAGKRIRQAVELLDVYPTLTAMSGLQAPPGLEGENLLPGLSAGQAKNFAMVETRRGDAMGKALYTDAWSYMVWDGGRAGRELYDLQQDPFQLHNLAEQDEYKHMVDSLARLLSSLHPPP